MLEYSLFLLIIFALATKQITAILMNGSIFAWLRDGIKKLTQIKSQSGQWFFTKLDELLSCPLCLTTQVAFWFCVLPSMIILKPDYSVVILIFVAFIATMTISGLAMILQNLSEHLAKDT